MDDVRTMFHTLTDTRSNFFVRVEFTERDKNQLATDLETEPLARVFLNAVLVRELRVETSSVAYYKAHLSFNMLCQLEGSQRRDSDAQQLKFNTMFRRAFEPTIYVIYRRWKRYGFLQQSRLNSRGKQID